MNPTLKIATKVALRLAISAICASIGAPPPPMDAGS